MATKYWTGVGSTWSTATWYDSSSGANVVAGPGPNDGIQLGANGILILDVDTPALDYLSISPGSTLSCGGYAITTINGLYNGGVLQAKGGVLTVNSAVSGFGVLRVDSSVGVSKLVLNDVTHAGGAGFVEAGGTIEVGSSGSLTLGDTAYISAGNTLQLDGSGTQFSGNVALAGGVISGTGTISSTTGVQGFGTVGIQVVGQNVLNAEGGTLNITGLVDLSGSAAALVLHSGSTLDISNGSTGTVTTPALYFYEGNDSFIDTAAPQTNVQLGDIVGFSASDKIQLQSLAAGDTLTYGANSVTIVNAATGTGQTFTFSGIDVSAIQLSDVAGVDTLTICFMAGTRISTPDGEAAIQTLRPGDTVLTADGVCKPVNWVGRQTISTFFADPIRSLPIRVMAGALGENVPSRDLLVSPDHALLVDGVMIHAGALVNGTSILRETDVPNVFVYYHVELDDHSLILAENTPAETFVDNVDRMNFDNWAEYEALYPEGKTVPELPYPRAKAHRQVPAAIRAALAERAEIIGAAKGIVA